MRVACRQRDPRVQFSVSTDGGRETVAAAALLLRTLAVR